MKKSLTLRTITGGLIAAVGLLAAGTLQAADTTTGPALSHKASSFLKSAAEGNQGEVALAQIAEQNAQNPEVKQLARQLREDHQQANQKVETLAQAHGVKLDTEPGFMQKREQSKFQKLTGAEFDKEYTKAMLEGHVKNLKLYQDAASDIQESDVKEYAQSTATKLREHLHHTEQAARAAGLDEKTITSITKKAPDAAGGTSEKQDRSTGSSTRPQ
jgi:putative membrane protein